MQSSELAFCILEHATVCRLLAICQPEHSIFSVQQHTNVDALLTVWVDVYECV